MQLIFILVLMALAFVYLWKKQWTKKEPAGYTLEDPVVKGLAQVELEEVYCQDRLHVEPEPAIKHTPPTKYLSDTDIERCVYIVDLMLFGVPATPATEVPAYISAFLQETTMNEAEVLALSERIFKWINKRHKERLGHDR
jgi:hypothetical protein